MLFHKLYEAHHVDETSPQGTQALFGEHKQFLFDGLEKWVQTVRKVYHRSQETALRVIYKSKGSH